MIAFEFSAWLKVSSLQKSFDDTFGNYLLHGITEVSLPEVVSWLPHTLGWKILGLGFLLYLGILVYQAALRWQQNRYRRVALRKLDQLIITGKDAPQSLKQLPLILKATALHAYPRAEIAQLSGSAWLQMLDSKCSATQFSSVAGEQLLSIAYQPVAHWQLEQDQISSLIGLARTWIKQHKAQGQELANV